MDRFEQVEDNWQWAQGPWEDGAEARIVHKATIEEAPSVEQIGEFAHASWKAGWADADMQLKSEYQSLQNWIVKTTYADGARYDYIEGHDGEHIASVDSHSVAEYIVAAVRAFAQSENYPPPMRPWTDGVYRCQQRRS
jgi:hypothetical protein